MIKGLLSLGIASVCMFSACTNDLEEVKRVGDAPEVPVSSTRRVEMTYSDSARLKARIKAPLRETYLGERQEVIFPEGIQVEFFDSKGKTESKMRADYAISYTGKDRLEARNNVVVENTAGEKLETEHLIWEQKEDRIHSDVFTRITSPDRVIYGDGFESNQDFSKYRILKVRGVINVNE
jgi:LPS export ABC transporter protein LptC